jgi:hypothetical protein
MSHGIMDSYLFCCVIVPATTQQRAPCPGRNGKFGYLANKLSVCAGAMTQAHP